MLRGQAFRKYVYEKQLFFFLQKYLSYILVINFFAEQTLSYQIGISNQRERERGGQCFVYYTSPKSFGLSTLGTYNEF